MHRPEAPSFGRLGVPRGCGPRGGGCRLREMNRTVGIRLFGIERLAALVIGAVPGRARPDANLAPGRLSRAARASRSHRRRRCGARPRAGRAGIPGWTRSRAGENNWLRLDHPSHLDVRDRCSRSQCGSSFRPQKPTLPYDRMPLNACFSTGSRPVRTRMPWWCGVGREG